MGALSIDLMADRPLTEPEIQARAQDMLSVDWPCWRRERALRRATAGDPSERDLLDAAIAALGAEVDLARENSALLASALAVEAAHARLALPAYSGPATADTEDGSIPHPEMVRDDAQRELAAEVVANASGQVLALVASRAAARLPVTPESEPEEPAGA